MMRCFKALIYKDKLRAAQDAIANRHIFPIRLAKLGTPGEPYPTEDDLSKFRDLLMMADDDPYRDYLIKLFIEISILYSISIIYKY